MTIKKYLDKLNNLQGKKVLLTGGTSGIGFSIADQLLFKGADVVILARNPNKAKEVKEKLLNKYPCGHLDFIRFDQADFTNIDEAVKKIMSDYSDFYALICNAGAFIRNKEVYDISPTIKTNFVGLAYFLKKLIPELHQEHRIIIQGSLGAGFRKKKINSFKDKLSSWQQYIISKAAVETLCYHYMQKDLKNLSFYLVEPGITNTDIIRDFPSPLRELGHLFMKVASHSNDKAALTAMLALQEDIKPCFIVPRSLFAWRGFPRIKAFPKRRYNENYLKMLDEIN